MRKRWDRLRRHVIMFYLIIAFPGLAVFLVLRFLTDLGDRILLLSLIPVGAILVCIYILYLIDPYRFSADIRQPKDDINLDA